MDTAERRLTRAFTIAQYRQELHDQVFHSDIYTLSKPRRLNHLVLHHCKYVSQLFVSFMLPRQAPIDEHSDDNLRRLCVDGLIICLSMANVCNKRLHEFTQGAYVSKETSCEVLLREMGKMAKTIEDIDHMGQTNPLGEIMTSAGLMADCYMNLYTRCIGEFNVFNLNAMFDHVEDRLLKGEQKNIHFKRHIADINWKMKLLRDEFHTEDMQNRKVK